MNESTRAAALEAPAITLAHIFFVFLVVGATSFGGGVVAYLRAAVVTRYRFVNDETFIEFLSISQSLPGLNATNMAVLIGERLRGRMGAVAATIGMCLPGGIFMLVAAALYKVHGDVPWVESALRGVAAAAVGLVLATSVQLGRKSLKDVRDYVFVLASILGIHLFHWKVPIVLLVVGALSIYSYRPSAPAKEAEKSQ
jgi:chromate transporter